MVNSHSEQSPSPLVLPELFIEMLNSAVGPDCAELIVDAIKNSPPALSVRINPAKWPSGENLPVAEKPSVAEKIWEILKPHFSEKGEKRDVAEPEKVPWCQDGIYLKSRPNFTLDPAFHAGAYYVQEPSSMIIEILRPIVSQADRVLDLCAAPGGKTTHLATMLRGASSAGNTVGNTVGLSATLTANEFIRSRAATLRDNITKWGDPRVTVTNLDPSAFAQRGEEYDFVLVDAPCSGEGMFRKDPGAISEWSPRAVEECALRQRKIVKDIWPALKPGGYLAYSTCTMNRHENEENIEWFIHHLDARQISLLPYLEATHSAIETVTDSAAVTVIEPAACSAAESVIESAACSAAESVIESAACSAAESVIESAACSAAEPAIEPAACYAAESAIEPAAFSAAEPAIEPAACSAAEPAIEPAACSAAVPGTYSATSGILVSSKGSLRLHPGLVKGEGIFIALLQKPEELTESAESLESAESSYSTLKLSDSTLSQSRRNKYSKSKFQNKSRPHNQSHKHLESIPLSSNQPEHYMALLNEYAGVWPSVELSRGEAIKYLLRETLSLPDSPLGYLRVTYGGLGLGFVKNIGVRANNLLPTSLRIRKA